MVRSTAMAGGILGLGLLFSATALGQAAGPVVMTSKVMSLDTAQELAQNVLDACRDEGYAVGVTVVDRAGNTQVVLRDSLAPELTLRISYQKAYTALAFNSATSALNETMGDSAIGGVNDVLFAAGGLPVEAGGTMLGGVGVSGAPGGDIDERCARNGLDEIMPDIEFEM